MRKLIRKNLEELAKVMPTIAENQKNEYVGGSVYFAPDGTRLGKIGTGDDIKVAHENGSQSPQEVFNGYNSNYTSGSTPGAGLSSADSGIKLQVFKYYAKTCANFTGEVNLIFGYNADGDNNLAEVGGGGTPDAFLNVSPYLDFNFHENDISSLMNHEGYHIRDTSNSATPQSEISANRYEISQPGFSGASENYQDNTIDNLHKAYEDAGLGNDSRYSIAQLRIDAGIDVAP